MKVIDCEQQTPEWYMHRKGVPSASEMSKIITSTGKRSSSIDGYIAQLIIEATVKAPAQWIGTEEMQRGNDLEPEARRLYSFLKEKPVEQVGFCLTDDRRFGCSPDGFIDDRKGGLEIKCPKLEIHVGYGIKGILPTAYKVQVHASMFVTGCNYWDFMSYHPDVDPFILRVERDDFTDKLGEALDSFYKELTAAREKFGVTA